MGEIQLVPCRVKWQANTVATFSLTDFRTRRESFDHFIRHRLCKRSTITCSSSLRLTN